MNVTYDDPDDVRHTVLILGAFYSSDPELTESAHKCTGTRSKDHTRNHVFLLAVNTSTGELALPIAAALIKPLPPRDSAMSLEGTQVYSKFYEQDTPEDHDDTSLSLPEKTLNDEDLSTPLPECDVKKADSNDSTKPPAARRHSRRNHKKPARFDFDDYQSVQALPPICLLITHI
eukprot:m.220198 g.220198  ORF g.220198 m.220198 type:complete len:175 (-) comp15593_c0_seq2:5637-6161(-)